METEDLEDFTMVHPGGGQPPRQQLGECEQREGQCGERDRVRGFSLLTWKSPSPTSTTRKRATPKVGAKVKTEEILDKTVDEVCGIEMVVGPRPMCHCQLPTQIHVGHTPKNPDRMPFRGTKEGNVPQAEVHEVGESSGVDWKSCPKKLGRKYSCCPKTGSFLLASDPADLFRL